MTTAGDNSKGGKHYPAMSEARRRMLSEPGHLYAVYSRYCDWIKIGFTSKGVRERIDGINHQYAAFAPFSLIGSTRSTWRAEQQIHYILAPFRQRHKGLTAELYPALRPLVGTVNDILEAPEWRRTDYGEWKPFIAWSRYVATLPINRIECELSYERYNEERRAA